MLAAWLGLWAFILTGCREKPQHLHEELKITQEISNLTRSTDQVVISEISTTHPTKKELPIIVEGNGVITYDTRGSSTISVRIGGRIERLYVKYNFQPIRKGQKLMEIYSPELFTAQQELIYLQESDPHRTDLLEGAKQRLHQLGLTEGQVAELLKARRVSYSFPVYSTVSGYITEENPGSQPGELNVREGKYVEAGESVFKVVSTNHVWAEFELYQKDAGLVKLNDPNEIILDNNQIINARVDIIQPFTKSGETFVKVRSYLSNAKGDLTIGQLVKLRISHPSGNALWLPATSVINLGNQKAVFVKRRGVLRSRVIETGQATESWIEIVSGVEATDSIAQKAQFLVDSEGLIRLTNKNQ